LAQAKVQLPYSIHTSPVVVQLLTGLAIVAAALGLRVLMEPWLEGRLELITLWGALVPLAWLLRGGVFWVCSLLGFVAAQLVVVAPHGSMDPGVLAITLAFSLLIITGLWASVRLARRSLQQYADVKTQEQLTESRLAAIVQNSDDAIISKDLSGRILSFNPAAERLYGYQAHEIIGKPIQTLIPPERLQEEEEILARIMQGERIDHMETFRRTRSGRDVEVSLTISPVRDETGRVIGVSKIARDITARKAMERERDAALQRFARVTQTLPDMVFLIDVDTFLPVLINPAVTQTMGYTLEELRGHGGAATGNPIIHPEDQEAVITNLRRAAELSDGELLDFEHRALNSTGAWAILRARLTPFERDAQGRCTVILAVDRDITRERIDQLQLAEYREGLERLVEQRTLELEKTHAQLRAAERMTALGTLSQGLGHDIGNLVLPLRLRVQTIRAEVRSDTARADIEAIDAGLSYVQGLSRSLRMLAMDPADPRQSGAGFTDLEEWWPTAEPVLKAVLPRSGSLKWDVHRAANGRLVAAIAPHQLLQAVFNLVQNAAEALEGTDSDPAIEVSAGPGVGPGGEAQVRVNVTDHGPGMTDEVRQRCMEPFFSTKHRRLSGGLGLSLVAGITSSVGGEVELKTAPGQGASFTLVLRAAELPTVELKSQPAGERPTAAISVSDPRTLAYMQWAMKLVGIEAKQSRENEVPMASVWVVDQSRAHQACDFAKEPGRWAVVLGQAPAPASNGESGGQVPKNERVLFAGVRPGVSELRILLKRAFAPGVGAADSREGHP